MRKHNRLPTSEAELAELLPGMSLLEEARLLRRLLREERKLPTGGRSAPAPGPIAAEGEGKPPLRARVIT